MGWGGSCRGGVGHVGVGWVEWGEVCHVRVRWGPLSVDMQPYGCLSTGSGRHSDAAHEIHLIGCCVLLKVVPKNVPHSGSSQMLSVDWHRSKRCIYSFNLVVHV